MKMKKVFMNSIFAMTMAVLITAMQFMGGGTLKVKAQENPTAHVRIEGLTGTMVSGDVKGANVFEMVKTLLQNNNIKMETDPKYPTYITTIGDLKASGMNGWMFYTKSNSKIITPPGGMDAYVPSNDEYIVVYYASFDTPYVNTIKFSPEIVKENEKTTIAFSFDHFDWNANKQVVSPIANAVVVIDELLPMSTNEKGEITLPYGLPNGQHTYKISGYRTNDIPTVVMDNGTFTIDGVNSPSMNYSDAAYSNKLVERDNSNVVKNIDADITATSNYIKNSSDAWSAISLSKLGIKPNEQFIQDSMKDIKENGIKDLYNTDIEKLIMGLAACGYNPYNFAGHDLVADLFNKDIKEFYTNDLIFGLMTMNYLNTEGKDYKINRESLIKQILSNKLSYNIGATPVVGWTYFGNTVDPDLTGAALSALAPYYSSNSEVKNTVDNVVKTLSALQNVSGYIPSQYGIASESLSFVILGLTSLGINPEEGMFKKAKGDLVSALLSFKGTDGQFKHELTGSNNKIATEQAFRALVSLGEFKKQGKFNLYSTNMDTSKLKVYGAEQSTVNTAAASVSAAANIEQTSSAKELPQTGAIADFNTVMLFGIVLMTVGIYVVLFRNKKIN
jgi:LPXTG-motif cell wall-anchored protein